MLKYLNILRPPLLVFKMWCDTCDNERAPAGCTPGAGCRLLQRVPGVTHHSPPPPVSGPRSPDLIGARARVAAAPHPATARLEAINCYLIGSVSLSNSCVPVNALQNSPPLHNDARASPNLGCAKISAEWANYN